MYSRCPYIAIGADEEHLTRSTGAAATYHDYTDITPDRLEQYLPTKKAL